MNPIEVLDVLYFQTHFYQAKKNPKTKLWEPMIDVRGSLTPCANLSSFALKELEKAGVNGWYCPDVDGFNVGGAWDASSDYISFFMIETFICPPGQVNDRGQPCNSDETKMKEIFKDTVYFSSMVQALVVTPSDYDNGINKILKYFTLSLDTNIYKEYFYEFSETELDNDYGWILSTSDKQNVLALSKEYLDILSFDSVVDRNLISKTNFYFVKDHDRYIRSYSKIQDLAAQVGGILEIFIIVGSFIVNSYNGINYNLHLLNDVGFSGYHSNTSVIDHWGVGLERKGSKLVKKDNEINSNNIKNNLREERLKQGNEGYIEVGHKRMVSESDVVHNKQEDFASKKNIMIEDEHHNPNLTNTSKFKNSNILEKIPNNSNANSRESHIEAQDKPIFPDKALENLSAELMNEQRKKPKMLSNNYLTSYDVNMESNNAISNSNCPNPRNSPKNINMQTNFIHISSTNNNNLKEKEKSISYEQDSICIEDTNLKHLANNINNIKFQVKKFKESEQNNGKASHRESSEEEEVIISPFYIIWYKISSICSRKNKKKLELYELIEEAVNEKLDTEVLISNQTSQENINRLIFTEKQLDLIYGYFEVMKKENNKRFINGMKEIDEENRVENKKG
eukprot:CAMPEP_0170522360 /NCGR_PEP_ID=MMETSP0209-20121228/7777_1 /TAXON_ID=665100 ORGANISM="Litonotus pictus, Strain P1" /NCGR_SAMPLE_ID=MMETSP0209 /ASSEMBLY_ACC=CAM_ASM_000301 /LENGTH=623 /DNA_ID=CAMNT_0010809815 /DNA_START=209 /DNA_END=2080 /DNA_ORIENTATION=+